jgi:hypothetical protein
MKDRASYASLAVGALLLAGCAGTPSGVAPLAPGAGTSATVSVSANDIAQARDAHVLSYHIMRLRDRTRDGNAPAVRKKYPADLVRKNGPIMKSAAAFNIYVNCKSGGETCWGDPEGFQKNLTSSHFVELLNQYTNASPGAYTLGGTLSLKYHTYTKLYYQDDLLTIVHAALAANGMQAGYSTIYHVFLPKGSDTCFDRTRFCYSPDRLRTFNFCAYHESVSFKDVAESVIVSIEPYQDVSGCASRASAGASALTNSTSSTLGHETFESITDPGPAFAWFNFTYDDEVADLCETFEWKIAVNGVQYSLQPMYSNHYHACADGP